MDLRLSAEEAEAWDRLRADAGLRSATDVVRALLRVRGFARRVLVTSLRSADAWASAARVVRAVLRRAVAYTADDLVSLTGLGLDDVHEAIVVMGDEVDHLRRGAEPERFRLRTGRRR